METQLYNDTRAAGLKEGHGATRVVGYKIIHGEETFSTCS